MKLFLFETMKEIIGDAKCELIGEIGIHKGGTSKQFIELFAPRVNKLTFYGYDIFDGEVPDLQFHKRERNAKGSPPLRIVEQTFRRMKRDYPNVDYKLHKGLTTDTLKPTVFDFVYIDGGHSYETVKHDYEQVKDSKLIVFDDVKINNVNKFVKELIAEGIQIEIVNERRDRNNSKHIWGVIRN
tara:strand:+ start:264 stop:815 length:552 start_codon:yes stop_codon:yes gene_type:complete